MKWRNTEKKSQRLQKRNVGPVKTREDTEGGVFPHFSSSQKDLKNVCMLKLGCIHERGSIVQHLAVVDS